jgi:hypothetical protein
VIRCRSTASWDFAPGHAAASARGILTDDEVMRWEVLYDETVAQGKFLWSVTFFIMWVAKAGHRFGGSANFSAVVHIKPKTELIVERKIL